MSDKVENKLNKKLNKAMHKWDYAKIEKFIEKGADINFQDSEGKTPLMFAVEKGVNDLIEFLINKEADIKLKDNYDQTVVEYAFERKNRDLMISFMKKGCQLSNGGADFFMINWALSNKDDELINLLVRSGLNLTVGTEGSAFRTIRDTLFCYASSTGNVDLMSFLLKNGAEIDSEDEHGVTPLIYAAEKGHVKAVSFLMENGVTIDSDVNGMTALKMAKKKGHQKIVELLSS